MTKRNRNKNNYKSENNIEVKQFAIVLSVVVVCVVGVYFFTRAFVSKDLFKDADLSDNDNTVVKIDYGVTTVGAILNRPYNEYYVMIYSSEDKKVTLYNTIRTKYTSAEDTTKLYYIDLSTPFNNQYYNKEESNPKAKTISDLKLGDLTLIKIKAGKIVKYIEDYETIRKEIEVKN